MKKIGDELKAFFKEQGITQRQISEKLGVSQPYIHGLLSGEKEFGKKQAKLFGELFGISPIWLLTGEGDMIDSSKKKSIENSTVIGNNVNGKDIRITHNDFSEMIKLQQGYQELLMKKDTQIDRLIAIIENNNK